MRISTDRSSDSQGRANGAALALAVQEKEPPKLFECKLCGKLFDAREEHPSCPECDSNDVERVG